MTGRLNQILGVDLRSLAAFRIGAAAVILIDLLFRSQEISAYFTDQGVMPRLARIELFEADDKFRFADVWSLHLMSGQYWVQALLLVLAAVFASCLLVGYRTRLSAVASWILLVSLDARNPMLLNSGDTLLRCMLLWSLFLPLGARFSIDQLREHSENKESRVFSAASAALLLQLAMMYFFSALFKWHEAWLTECSAVYYALHCDAYLTTFGVRLGELPDAILQGLTLSTFALEFGGPLVVFSPWWTGRIRLVAIAVFWSFHVGLGVAMTIGLFPAICMVGWLVMLPTEFWEWPPIQRALSSITRLLPAKRLSTENADPAKQVDRSGASWLHHFPSLVANTVVLLALVYTVIWNVRELDFKRWEPYLLSRDYNGFGRALGLDQNWAMFSPVPRTEDGWLVMRGLLRDGSEVNLWDFDEPLPWDKPKLVSATYHTQRWRKYLDNLTTEPYGLHRMHFANWLQSRWNARFAAEDESQEVVEIEIIQRLEITPPPGTPIPDPQSRVLWKWYYE